MSPQIPQYIFRIKIGTSTCTEVLEILGRLFSELYGYASTASQPWLTAEASRCATRLRQIERQLRRRGLAGSLDDLFALPNGSFDHRPLSALSIGELDCLYRQRPARIRARIADGLEPLTRYLESQIAAELSSRPATNLIEQLKVDYCLITHRLEMLRMARLLRLPYDPETRHIPTPQPLTSETILAEIDRLRAPRTLSEREALVRIVDSAIEHLRLSSDPQTLASLAAELIELSRRDLLRIPAWVNDFLSKAIRQWTRTPRVPDTLMVLPLLNPRLLPGAV